MDASGSMKGFVDVTEPYMRDKLPIILSDLRTNLKTTPETEAYYMVTDWNEQTQPVSMSWESFKESTRESASYKGGDTQLHTILKKVADQLKSPDDVALFITDGVLSMGSSFFDSKGSHKGEDNSHYLGELTASVKETLDHMQGKGLAFALVRTTGNFNGKYYCAANERNVQEWRDSIMRERPLFYMLVGKEQALEKVLVSISIKESDVPNYQATLMKGSEPQRIAYSLAPNIYYNSGLNFIDYHLEGEQVDSTCIDVHINLDGFDVDNPLKLYLFLPDMSAGQLVSLEPEIASDNDTFFTLDPLAKSECRDSIDASDNHWKRVGQCFLMKFKTKDEIRNATRNISECNLSLTYSNPLSNENYSISNDLGRTLREMEGRTFGLANIMEAIQLSRYKNYMADKNSKKVTLRLNVIID